MIHLGFTGTRFGMSDAQLNTVRTLVTDLANSFGPISVHHGDCVGADEEFHYMCMSMGLNITQVYKHSPSDPKLRAYCQGGIQETPVPYEQRNHAIVDASMFVIAAPLEEQPQARGGTWQVIRFSMDRGNLWRIVFPSGVAVKG
jgi:hypothetical protein